MLEGIKRLLARDNRTDYRKIGDRGEDIAVKYLKKHGYKILDRNVACGKSEIDIIAGKKDTVAFIEVKSTASDASESMKRPSYAVDSKKREYLIRAARQISARMNANEPNRFIAYRFDVIEVFLNRDKPEINHIENAFYINRQPSYTKYY